MHNWQPLDETIGNAKRPAVTPQVQRQLLLEAVQIIHQMIDRIDEALIQVGRMTEHNGGPYEKGDSLYLRGTARAVSIEDVRVNSQGLREYKPVGTAMYFPAAFFERHRQAVPGASLLEGDGC